MYNNKGYLLNKGEDILAKIYCVFKRGFLWIKMSDMLGLNQTLEKFYSKNDTPQRDPVSYTRLFNYVTEVVKKVGEIATQFKPKELVLVGSSASDVSAIRAQEMDRLLLIDIKGKVENIDRLHEFAKLKVDSSVQVV